MRFMSDAKTRRKYWKRASEDFISRAENEQPNTQAPSRVGLAVHCLACLLGNFLNQRQPFHVKQGLLDNHSHPRRLFSHRLPTVQERHSPFSFRRGLNFLKYASTPAPPGLCVRWCAASFKWKDAATSVHAMLFRSL